MEEVEFLKDWGIKKKNVKFYVQALYELRIEEYRLRNVTDRYEDSKDSSEEKLIE